MFKNPVTLYGSSISYFTGKMENYFKIRGIPYKRLVSPYPSFEKKMKKMVGIHQMPAVVLPDGRWMTDTTMMIQWFESKFENSSIVPADSTQAFICYLLEDWADEWWWRPAMHYRWHYKEGAEFASDHLAKELLGTFPAPHFLKKMFLSRRQRNGYTVGDGISQDNIDAVEANVRNLFINLDKIFSKRSFIFGETPSLADIGLSGPFYRHFALDPVPLKIIKNEAPSILNWLEALQTTQLKNTEHGYIEELPADLNPLLEEIGSVYLPYLCKNVDAVRSGKKYFEFKSGELNIRKARFSQYRVWCLKELQEKFCSLSEYDQSSIEQMLRRFDCWEPLWMHKELPLEVNQEERLPFWADRKMIGVNE
jgi:glutathione S-transferase